MHLDDLVYAACNAEIAFVAIERIVEYSRLVHEVRETTHLLDNSLHDCISGCDDARSAD